MTLASVSAESHPLVSASTGRTVGPTRSAGARSRCLNQRPLPRSQHLISGGRSHGNRNAKVSYSPATGPKGANAEDVTTI